MNDQTPMTNDQANPKAQMPKQRYDLEERTAAYSETVISFCQRLPQNTITRPLITQIIRSATSIGHWELDIGLFL